MNYNKAAFLASYGLVSQIPNSDLPEIVFAGRSNVGKSSLLNKLCNRKNIARVSATPGKTATINYYEVDGVYFVDLPGYGFAKVSDSERLRWDKLINGYFKLQRKQALFLLLLDCRHEPSKEDYQMMEYLKYNEMTFWFVLTKADKLKKSQLNECIQRFNQIAAENGCKGITLTSSEKNTGIDELRQIIDDHVSVFTE